jgi:hypothetical protein
MLMNMAIKLEINWEGFVINKRYSLFPFFKYRETEGIKDVGTNFWNEGKTQEIASRYVHLDDHNL